MASTSASTSNNSSGPNADLPSAEQLERLYSVCLQKCFAPKKKAEIQRISLKCNSISDLFIGNSALLLPTKEAIKSDFQEREFKRLREKHEAKKAKKAEKLKKYDNNNDNDDDDDDNSDDDKKSKKKKHEKKDKHEKHDKKDKKDKNHKKHDKKDKKSDKKDKKSDKSDKKDKKDKNHDKSDKKDKKDLKKSKEFKKQKKTEKDIFKDEEIEKKIRYALEKGKIKEALKQAKEAEKATKLERKKEKKVGRGKEEPFIELLFENKLKSIRESITSNSSNSISRYAPCLMFLDAEAKAPQGSFTSQCNILQQASSLTLQSELCWTRYLNVMTECRRHSNLRSCHKLYSELAQECGDLASRGQEYLRKLTYNNTSSSVEKEQELV